MRGRDLKPRDRAALRQELATAAKAWVRRGWRMRVLIAGYANKYGRTGVRTDTDAELMSLAAYRLHEAIYNLNLIKQALIGL